MNYIFVAEENEAKHIDNFPNSKIILTGIGGVNTIKTISRLLQSTRFTDRDKFFNVGYCGTSCRHLNIGDVCKVGCSKVEKESAIAPEPEIKLCDDTHVCFSANDFVTSSEHDGLFDMELYTLATVFPQIQSYKIISDKLDFDTYKQVSENSIETSWKSINDILGKILTQE